MPPHLVEDAAAAGIELLPGLGDLEPECECGAWDHCAHTAALCYQVARLLDQDPFVLLLMRGRGEQNLLDDLQARSAAPVEEASDAEGVPGVEGVDAAEAFAAGGILPPLPAPAELPLEPGPPPSLDTEAAPGPGVDPVAVRHLGARTAVEAHRLLAAALRPHPDQQAAVGELTVAQDAVRLAVSVPDRAMAERLAEGSGRDETSLADATRAWALGGVAALSVLEEEWVPDGERHARACAALESAWDEDERPCLRAAGNRWTVVGDRAQIRLGRDGRWWPYRRQQDRWLPAGPPALDPATALASTEPDSTEAEG